MTDFPWMPGADGEEDGKGVDVFRRAVFECLIILRFDCEFLIGNCFGDFLFYVF